MQFQNWAKQYGRDRDAFDYDIRGWWKTNGGADPETGHLTDQFKKPNHPTFSQESQYNGVDGYIGGQWIGDDKRGFVYRASPTNLQMHNPNELRDYFKRVEPGVRLQLPSKHEH